MIRDVELTPLRYLVAIDAAGNVGRAAESLFVSQPALSYALKRLEAELGVRLFERHAGGVTATEAGRDVIAAARKVIRQAELVTAVAERHRLGQVGVLRVGFEASGAGDLTSTARAEFARRFPQVRVEPKRFDWAEETVALREGRVDIAFVWLPADLTGLDSEVVHVEPRVVGLPSTHPLAGRDHLTLPDVKDEPLIWTKRVSERWRDWWAINPRPDGSTPRWGPTNDNVEEMLEQVAAGAGICFAPSSMARYYTRAGLAWLPLTGVAPLQVALAWRTGSTDPLIGAFAATVRELVDDPAVESV